MLTTTDSLYRLDNVLESYRLQAKIDGKSQKTIDIYTTSVNTLLKFLDMDGLSTDVTEIGKNEFNRFILYLRGVNAYRNHPYTKPQNKGLSGHTINGYLRAIRAFWGWLVNEEIVDSNPFEKIKVPKPPKKAILPFSENQIQALFNVIDTRSTIGFRDWTITLTLLDTGIRAMELATVKMEDTNLEQRFLKVFGKGAKERIVPIGGTVQRAIAKYINRHRPKPISPIADYLFLTRDGNPITVNRIEAIISHYAEKANIEGVRCSPHTFRHTFAISYIRNGGDVFTLQRVLGHETIDMVRNYVNMATHDVQAAHQKYSPVDNFKLKARRPSS